MIQTARCEIVFAVIQMGLFASSSPNLEWSTFVWSPASAISSSTSDKPISELSSDLSSSWVHFMVDISSAISSGVQWNRIYFKGYSENGVLFHLDRIWLVPSGRANTQASGRIECIAFVYALEGPHCAAEQRAQMFPLTLTDLDVYFSVSCGCCCCNQILRLILRLSLLLLPIPLLSLANRSIF